jgi:hypothetical protein
MLLVPRTELETMLFLALQSYPCRCAYQRAKNGQPIYGKDGERILEQKCSRHIAMDAYEQA